MKPGRLGAKIRYGVFRQDSQWLLCCGEHRLGRYDDMDAALSAGQRAASQAVGSGFDAELYVMDVGGELRRADPAP
ncbi:MAG TPA: hypothetical protein VHZ26_17380 [Caulobacteraceae bacterium]|jgi:hypothetical protein|nr:hypothetical protein [Caulobacteraceae bacterium]